MKLRIAVWATAGALVALLWSVFVSTTLQNPSAAGGISWALVCLTCPIALAHHYALGFYSVLLANAATYALIGALIEFLRLHRHPHAIAA